MSAHAHDDWRLTVRFLSEGHARAIFASLRRCVAAARASDRLDEGVAAERDHDWLRVYAASYSALRRAEQIIAEVAAGEGVRAEASAQRRDVTARHWEVVPLPPLPESDTSLVAEHRGSTPWGAEAEPQRVQIRFEMPDRNACVAFAETLTRAGYEVHRRGSYLYLFADDHDSAHDIGDQLRAQAPKDAQLYFTGEDSTTVFF
jgi:hypothetical protein